MMVMAQQMTVAAIPVKLNMPIHVLQLVLHVLFPVVTGSKLQVYLLKIVMMVT
jgi:hypothetical protein